MKITLNFAHFVRRFSNFNALFMFAVFGGAIVLRAASYSAPTSLLMRIKRHRKSHIVRLSDESVWHIWPGDLAKTLGWLPTTDLKVISIDHDVCSHALVDCSDGSSVRVSNAAGKWPLDQVRRLLGCQNDESVSKLSG